MTAENENEAWVAPRPTSKLDQLPLVGLLRTYRREWIGGDLRGGISASLVMIPSVIAYAELANLRPEYGLYAALMAMLGYALFASSRQVIAGPDAALTLLVARGAIQASSSFSAVIVLLVVGDLAKSQSPFV